MAWRLDRREDLQAEWVCSTHLRPPEVLVAHANARLTPYARLLAARRVEQGHKPAEVAKQLGVSRQTVYKWARRYRAEGEAGLADRSSRPRTCPRRTPEAMELAIVSARLAEHAGPAVLAGRLGLPASTIGAVVRRRRVPRLAELARLTGQLAARPRQRRPLRAGPARRARPRRRQEARQGAGRRRLAGARARRAASGRGGRLG